MEIACDVGMGFDSIIQDCLPDKQAAPFGSTRKEIQNPFHRRCVLCSLL